MDYLQSFQSNELIVFLTRIFNVVFSRGIFPRSWSVGSTKTIHKKGDERLPTNYRGITLLPMGKLNLMIDCWNGLSVIRMHNCKNRRTTDALFITHTISLIATKRKVPMFHGMHRLGKGF